MSQVIPIVIGALMGALISFISFQYKQHLTGKGKLNKSLFNLLSVWSSMSMNEFLFSETYKNAIANGLKRKFPNTSFPADFESEMIASMRKVMPVENQHELYEKYHASIEELALIRPMLAFQLSSNRFLVEYLKYLNNVAIHEDIDENSEAFLSSCTNFAYSESIKTLEEDMLELSCLVSKSVQREVEARIKKKQSKLKSIPDSDIDKALATMFDPAIRQITQKQNVA